ncbi:MAG TPA: ribokinase [Roseateles sp.]|uniref:ribokinase n=1 Tax=Roseateles sp. TaxID=1971397 RepID=UPI002EDA0761
MSRSVLVAGSANLDFVVRASHVPAPGETVLGRGFACFPGGKGANQAVAAARAGTAPVRMLLALGRDAHAAALEASLTEAGVQLHVVRDGAEPTGCAFICVSDTAENAITVAPGANNALRDEHLPALDGVSHLLLQLETPIDTVTAYARRARAAGVSVVLNAAPARPLPAELLDAVDLLVVNESELAAIAGTADGVEAALARIAVPTVIVTLGSNGCLARHEGAVIRLGAFPVRAVDTTAAGDTFCGVLVAALSRGDGLRPALRRASAAAALACTRAGAQASIPQANEIDTLLAQDSATIPA